MHAIGIILAGGLGAYIRYLISQISWMQSSYLPWSTFVVNALGSIMLVLLWSLYQQSSISEQHYLLLGVGFLGGLTTYSSFNLEVVRMLADGHYLRVFLYLALTLGGCLFGACLSLAIFRSYN